MAWSVVPYLLLAVFADFLHVHPLAMRDSAAAGAVHRIAEPPGRHPYRAPDTTCAICQWHRIGSRLDSATSVVRVVLTAPDPVVSAIEAVPDSPVPHPAAFRGPPAPSIA